MDISPCAYPNTLYTKLDSYSDYIAVNGANLKYDCTATTFCRSSPSYPPNWCNSTTLRSGSSSARFFAGPQPPLPRLPHKQEFPSSSCKLQELETDDVVGILAVPICTFLSSSLAELRFWRDKEVERFTKEQEDALQLLTSLEEIRFWWCQKLQSLPAGLHGLPNLKRLNIYCCAAIRSLPKDGLTCSLQELEIDNCPAIQSLPKNCLPSSLQKLEIRRCPAIRSLPKDGLPSSLQILKIYGCLAIRSLPKVNDLPSSLRELDVRDSKNEDLRRQCHKLIGIIPVVYA